MTRSRNGSRLPARAAALSTRCGRNWNSPRKTMPVGRSSATISNRTVWCGQRLVLDETNRLSVDRRACGSRDVLGACAACAAAASDTVSCGRAALPRSEGFRIAAGGLERVGGKARVAGEREFSGLLALAFVPEAGGGAARVERGCAGVDGAADATRGRRREVVYGLGAGCGARTERYSDGLQPRTVDADVPLPVLLGAAERHGAARIHLGAR